MHRISMQRDQKRVGLADGKFVRFTEPVLAQIEALADSEKRTVSNVIRVLVEEALASRARRRKAA